MRLLIGGLGRTEEAAVPEKSQRPLRLVVWYKQGCSQVSRGFTPTEDRLRRPDEDSDSSEADREGRGVGDTAGG